MSPEVALREKLEGNAGRKTGGASRRVPGRPTILIAAVHPEVRLTLENLLGDYAVNKIWVDSVKEMKRILQSEKIAACLCAFWLQDGTYRELVRHVRRERMEVPVIIVSEPACSQDYREYLAAMNIEALNFLCYPYQKSDLHTLLGPGIAEQDLSDDTAIEENKAA